MQLHSGILKHDYNCLSTMFGSLYS